MKSHKTMEQQILDQLKLARQKYQNQEFAEATALYEEIEEQLKDDPVNHPVIQIELAWSFYQQQKFQKTISLLKSALDSNHLSVQQQFDCYRIIGFSHEMLGHLEESTKYLEKSLEFEVPAQIKKFAYFELAKILFTQGNMIEAEHYLKLVKPLFGKEEKDYQSALGYYLGFIYYFQKQMAKASRNFDYVIKNATDHKTKAGGYFGIAHIHYFQKDYALLRDLCEKILRIDESFYDKETLGYFMCKSLMHTKKWEELKVYYRELKEKYPEGRFQSEYTDFESAIKKKKIPAPKKK